MPLSILKSIVSISNNIYKQAAIAKSNKKKIARLADRLKVVVSAIENLTELPRQQQFIEALQALEITVKEIEKFNEEFIDKTSVQKFFFSGGNKSKFELYSESLAGSLAQLNIGLSAQNLIDREQDRQDEEEDHKFIVSQLDEVLVQQEKTLRAIQETRLDKSDLEAIIARQMQSLKLQAEDYRQNKPEEPKSLLPAHQQINFYDVIFEKKIGEGSFGAIYAGRWREQPVAIKLIERVVTPSDREQFVREAQIMSRLQNEYIVPFYGACLEEGRLCIVMGNMEKGDLELALSALSQDERLQMARDLARGLHYLHEQKVLHGDIKPKNVLLNKHKQAKWADFGLSKTQQSRIATLNLTSQSVQWQAPESWQARSQMTPASDVYSFGVLLWTLMTGRQPYTNLRTDLEIIQQVQGGFRESMDNKIPEDCRKLIERCWAENPLMRPKTTEIIQVLDKLLLEPNAEALYEQAVAAHKKSEFDKAYSLYERSANKQFAKAYASLGLFPLQGIGACPVDKARAKDLFERGIAAKHPRAAFNLARMYEKADGVEQDNRKALNFYKLALEWEPNSTDYKSKVELLSKLVEAPQTNYAAFSKS